MTVGILLFLTVPSVNDYLKQLDRGDDTPPAAGVVPIIYGLTGSPSPACSDGSN